MPWYRNEQPTPFDASPIEGMTFLNGDVLARLIHAEWARGHKYPLITFPSGTNRELSAEGAQNAPAHVHLFGTLTLPIEGNSDAAMRQIAELPIEHGIGAVKSGRHQITVSNRFSERAYIVSYNDTNLQLENITPLPQEAMELLDGERRAMLPPLYAGEKAGLKAVAPLKFFTPDSGWTWYPTEFDGDDLFFGLVSGLDVEMGYFSLSELESVRGPLGLPIERDLYFQPKTLGELKDLHERGETG